MHHALTHSHTSSRTGKITVALATSKDQIRAAQALRYRIFADEMGAKLNTKEFGIDEDLFDAYCDHLIAMNDETGEVVGTYRILPPHQAKKVGSYYSDIEFDLTRLQHIRPQLVEFGRSCVDANYRTGSTIARLWAGLSQYMRQNNYQYMMGCASIPLSDGGHRATSLYNQLKAASYAPIEWRVFPRHPLPLAGLAGQIEVEIPPLIKGYIKAGAMVCGEPAWDPDFNSADFFMLLPMNALNARHVRHFSR
ncbi:MULTISPECIES: GNAT family N-acetyltransferase [Chitinibacter]|nr:MULTISPECIES: GNAT family N-acyltransferase [Chitinibacter]